MATGGHPIDRGWAWMCLLGSHLAMFFLIGGFKTLGILFVEFHETFDSTSASTAIVLGLIPGFMSLLSPIATALGEYYGNRVVVIVGGITIALACFLTSFAVSMVYVICSFGVLTGIGYGITFGPALVVVGQFFDKRRSFANGVAVAGGSMGQLIIPLLLRGLIDAYLWRGALLIYSALALHVVVAGFLFRPVSFWDKKTKPDKMLEFDTENPPPPSEVPVPKALMQVKLEGSNSKVQSTPNLSSAAAAHDKDHPTQTSFHSLNLIDGKRKIHKSPAIHANSGHLALRFSQPLYTSTGSLYFQPMQDMIAKRTTPGTSPRVPFFKLLKVSFCCCAKNTAQVPSLFDWSLFKNYLFLMYIFGIATGNTGYVNLFLIIPPFANDLGLAKQNVALLISIAGVCDLVCRIAGGYFADLGYIKRTNIMAVTILITAIATFVCPLFPSWPVMVVYCIIIGTMGGFYISLFLVVLIDVVGLERTPKGFGLTIMIMGGCNLLIPALLGYMRDATGSWYGAFVFCGVAMVLCCVSFVCEPFFRRLEASRNDKVKDTGQEGRTE